MSEGAVRSLFVATGAGMVATAAWMIVDPGGFVAAIASFGHDADHFVRDLATFLAPYGVALMLAARYPAWRVPVAGLAAFQNGLHLANHVADIGTATTGWHGPANVVSLAILEVWLITLAVAARGAWAHEH